LKKKSKKPFILQKWLEVGELGSYILPPDTEICIKFAIRILGEQMMSFLQHGLMHMCAFYKQALLVWN
jgi:hypothetical protein